jgi:ferredoxin
VVTTLLKKSQRPVAFVDDLACTGCDKCNEHCPFDCLHLEATTDPESPFFEVMRVEEPKCTGCRECEKACPYDAIFVFRRDQVPAWLQANVNRLQTAPRRREPEASTASPPPASATP